MDFTVEKSSAGTDHFVFGELGSVTEHTKGDWPGCRAGWYAHADKGSRENGNCRGPYPTRAAAEQALFATAL